MSDEWEPTYEAVDSGTRIVLGPDQRFEELKAERDALAAALSAAQDALRELKQHDADSTDPNQKLPSWAIRIVDRALDA